jgi:hypothetical protein
MRSAILVAAVAAALFSPAFAHATDEASPFKLSGFGTLGVVTTDTDKGMFTASPLQPKGPSNNYDFGTDSVLAGQVNYKATQSLSFVGQLVVNRTADDDYKPHVEWAFGRYDFNGNLAVRVGIMAIPAFLSSESRLVGFANPWVRPPQALYSQLPNTSFRGVDLVYRTTLGEANVAVQPYYGNSPSYLANGPGHHFTADNDDLTGVNVTGELGSWTGRVGYLRQRFTANVSSLTQIFDGIRAVDPFVPGAAAYAAELEPVGKLVTFVSAGVAYEGANVLFQAELARRRMDFFAPDTTSGYATFGYRFGSVLPYATYSQTHVDKLIENTLIPTVGPLAPLGMGLNTLLATQNTGQKTIALGTRWQFAKNADVKLQWDRVDLSGGAVGNFRFTTPGFSGAINVYSAAVDFVF